MGPHHEITRWLIVYGEWRDPTPARSGVTALQHALQTATRAEEESGDVDDIVMALIHDAARPLNAVYHGEVIAQVMRGKLPDKHVMALYYHGVFQADLLEGTNLQLAHAERPWYPIALKLADWDAASFDPAKKVKPLSYFSDHLAEVLNR